jgi:uncharacterized membrane protein
MKDNDPNQYTFPSRINDPVMIFIFPVVQLVPAVVVVMGFMLASMPIEGSIVGIVTFLGIGKLLNNSFIDVYMHRMWRLGIMDIAFKTTVNPMIKRYFG